MHACRLCCIDTFNEIEAGYEKSSCYAYVDENNASSIEIEAGLLHGILCTFMICLSLIIDSFLMLQV